MSEGKIAMYRGTQIAQGGTLALLPAPAARAEDTLSPAAQAIGTNLLVNPGFEGIGKPVDNSLPNPDNWTRDTFKGVPYSEIFTPEGWVTWWQEGEYKRPECKVIPNEPPFNSEPVRIYQGYYSGMCFTFFGKQNAGYFQVVRDLPPGSIVEGSFYAHAWSCGEDDPPLSCGDPYAFSFQVGIDPNGGTDPFSPNIVWSAPYYHYDTFGLVGPVQATVGPSGAVTFFTRALGKWPLKHNDAYVDNASAETPTPTPPPPPPTPAIPPTPQFTPTPRPDGAIVHTVVAGDTLFGIALAYDVPVEQIYKLNGLDSSSILQIGQEIVISRHRRPRRPPNLRIRQVPLLQVRNKEVSSRQPPRLERRPSVYWPSTTPMATCSARQMLVRCYSPTPRSPCLPRVGRLIAGRPMESANRGALRTSSLAIISCDTRRRRDMLWSMEDNGTSC